MKVTARRDLEGLQGKRRKAQGGSELGEEDYLELQTPTCKEGR